MVRQTSLAQTRLMESAMSRKEGTNDTLPEMWATAVGLNEGGRAKGVGGALPLIPISSSICPVGHINRMEPGEAYPD